MFHYYQSNNLASDVDEQQQLQQYDRLPQRTAICMETYVEGIFVYLHVQQTMQEDSRRFLMLPFLLHPGISCQGQMIQLNNNV